MPTSVPCPLSRKQIVDAYFIEHRARVLDVAAFLDRVDRADDKGSTDDFRMRAFRRAVTMLGDGEPDRARRVLELLSDPTKEPIPSAPSKGAAGAFNPAS